jgi:FlaA1/EpsC-like NDP-sugar epimerase
VLDACGATGVEQIVYPSTDKAIEPPSLYGATKRLVEAMLRAAAARGGPHCAIVRFVNVLGSQGSAPETFARQIVQGQPLTVTHREMRRFWITADHAVLLLLHAACLPDGAVVVAPDAGEEVPVLEIARRLYHQLRPGQPEPPIAVTGLRPGERLSEPLFAPGERAERMAGLPGVIAVRGQPAIDAKQVDREVAQVAQLLRDDAPPAVVRGALFAAGRTLQSAV